VTTTDLIIGTCVGETPARPVSFDLDRLVFSRLLVQATSGGGKSWLLRRLLEQSFGAVPHIVIDPEGEFNTLREKHDYVLAAARGGDCLANVRTAPLLARRLLELRVSAIVDIYELLPSDRILFVKAFLTSLMNAPKALWNPTIVVVDEAHRFAPEEGKAASTEAMVNLASAGRKRGFCSWFATQRIAKLSKDAAAELGNVLIGRTTLDVDQARAMSALGFRGDARRTELRELPDGHFFGFGPALRQGEDPVRGVVAVRVGEVRTTHPKAGERVRTAPLPPASARVKKVLAALSDLPAEAETEDGKVASLEAKVKSLQAQLVNVTGRSPTLDKAAVEEIGRKAYERGRAEAGHAVKAANKRTGALVDVITRAKAGIAASLGDLLAKARAMQQQVDAETPARHVEIDAKTVKEVEAGFHTFPGKINKSTAETRRAQGVNLPPEADAADAPQGQPEQKILDAIAWLNKVGIPVPEINAIALIAGYRPGGGAFKNPKGRLSTKGLVTATVPGTLVLTERGQTFAAAGDRYASTNELHAAIFEVLGGPEGKILKVLIGHWPGSLSTEETARAAGYEAGGGAFKNPKGRLSTLKLIEAPMPGQLRARDILFPNR
jgi:hypothetical protein